MPRRPAAQVAVGFTAALLVVAATLLTRTGRWSHCHSGADGAGEELGEAGGARSGWYRRGRRN